MGARPKYTDEQLRKITLETIEMMDAHQMFVIDIKNADVYRYAKEIYPDFTKPDAYKDVVTRTLKQYQEKRLKFIRSKNTAAEKTDIEFLRTFHGERFFQTYKDDPQGLRKELNRFERCIKILLEVSDISRERLDTANTRILKLSSSGSELTAGLVKEIEALKKENAGLHKKIDELKAAWDDLERVASYMVIKDNHLGNVSYIDDPMAKTLTYLNDSNAKIELIDRMRRGHRTDGTE